MAQTKQDLRNEILFFVPGIHGVKDNRGNDTPALDFSQFCGKAKKVDKKEREKYNKTQGSAGDEV